MLGSAYFQRLVNMWDGNYPLAVASYNAGAGNVRKWVNNYGDPRGNVDIVSWIEKIPFEETRGYVQRVLENSVVYDRLNPSLPGPQAVHISAYLGKSRPASPRRKRAISASRCSSNAACRPRFITPQGFARIRAEYEQLFGIERPKMVETIAWAAAQWRPVGERRLHLRQKRLREIDRRLSYLSKVMKIGQGGRSRHGRSSATRSASARPSSWPTRTTSAAS